MKLYLREDERRPQPPPLPVDDRRPVAFGIAIWTGLLIIGLLQRDRLAADGHEWWLWTAVTGIALGLFGLYYLHRMAVRAARADEERRQP